MPQQFRVTEIRLNSIVTCLKHVLPLLNDLNDAFGTPFVLAIANTTLSLITAVQSIKRNKNECIQLLEQVHELLYAIVNLHMQAEPAGNLSPAILHHVGKFTETFHKIHTFVEVQQDGNKIKSFLRHSETSTLLKECHAGLQEACQVFKTETSVTTLANINQMQKRSEVVHKELLELISTLSDGTSSDDSSFIHHSRTGLQTSSSSFSMLPAQPKIFHGRDPELDEIIGVLMQESARIAILGPGGMGKSSLAKAALHHPQTAGKYQNRFFVACDSAITSGYLMDLIGEHIGLKPGKDLTKPVTEYFASSPPCLLVLDNLETIWEPIESRRSVEELLSVLTDISHLALVITMRGAERPANVRWTHPFLQPLKPLSDYAAQQAFIDVAEDFHDTEDVRQLLSFTDNLPLAVNLMAHLVDYEGCDNVLARWDRDRTTMLSSGSDKQSNLDKSINISLSSPRMTYGARDLLSLLSILPDGLSDIELLQSGLLITDILACKATLLATSLAHTDDRRRLKSLVPIREHMRQFHPIPKGLLSQLQTHFHLLLEVYQQHSGTQNVAGRSDQILSNLGNIHQILLQGLQPDNPNLAKTINDTIVLNSFHRLHSHSRHRLMDHIPTLLASASDAKLEVLFLLEVLNSHMYHPVVNHEEMITKATTHLPTLNDPVLESRFYTTVGYYLFIVNPKNLSSAMSFLNKGLQVARSSGNIGRQCAALIGLAETKWQSGDYHAAQMYANETQGLAQMSASLYNEALAIWIQIACHNSVGNCRTNRLLHMCQRGRNLLQLCGMSGGTLYDQMLRNEAEVYLQKSEYAEARSINAQIVQDTTADQHMYAYACGLLNLAQIDILIGASACEIHRSLDKAESIFNTMELPAGITYCEIFRADLCLREGDTLTSQHLFQHSHATCYTHSEAVLLCLARLGDISQWPPGDFSWSSRWTMVYIAYAKKMKNKPALLKALQFLGDVFFIPGDYEAAHSLFTMALEEFTIMDIHHSRARCILRLGDISKQTGDLAKAAELWEEARPLFERCLQMKDVAQIDSRLSTAHGDKIILSE